MLDGIDDSLIMADDERYACPSMRALFKWFGGHLPALYRSGYRIHRYTAREYAIGDSGLQVIFNVRTATRLA